MWTDNETAQDFLNFGGIAKTVAEIIEQAQSRPISISVSGAWGVGKSGLRIFWCTDPDLAPCWPMVDFGQ